MPIIWETIGQICSCSTKQGGNKKEVIDNLKKRVEDGINFSSWKGGGRIVD